MNLGNDLWNIYDGSPERGALLLYWQRQRAKDSMEGAIALADVASGTVLRKFPLLERARFADSGKAICGVGGEDWHHTIECMEAETGKRLAITVGWRDPYVEAAHSGKRIIVSEHNRKLDWIDGVWREGPLTRREIWDFATGRVLASWRPEMQRIQIGASAVNPYSCAISPDGEFVVEGGSGSVTLYKVAP